VNARKRSLHVHTHHFLAPPQGEIRVVERPGNPVRQLGRGAYAFLIQLRSGENRCCILHYYWRRSYSAEHDAGVRNRIVGVEREPCAHAQYREVK
jgi:hypothetical protein